MFKYKDEQKFFTKMVFMKYFKYHLKSIKDYEKENNSLQTLNKFFLDSKSDTILSYCDGSLYLPSFMMLKQIQLKYDALCNQDSELNNLFLSAIQCSKLFYYNLINLSECAEKLDSNKYEEEFERVVEPLGQQLINILNNIKYRIKIVKLKNARISLNSKSSIFYSLFTIFNIIFSSINNFAYKWTLLVTMDHIFFRKAYYVIIATIIITIWIAGFMFFDDIAPISTAFINIISSISILLFAISSYPIGDFAKKDISGKNMVAYKYKLLLKKHFNKKLLNIFTLQQGTSSKTIDFS